MNKSCFYGEYTLLHWIELILQKNIVLPKYQRSFVWKKEQVEIFLKKLKDGIFVPPVIIGSLEYTDSNENMILDGQQRLTSILLGYLGIYPKEDVFRATDDPLYESTIGNENDADEDIITIEWSFKLLTNDMRNRTKADILANIDSTKYEFISAGARLDDTFLNNNYLGFSYIIPKNANETDQQRFYSTVFHDINQQGVALQGQESRRSLYYLNKDFVPYFEPNTVTPILKLIQNGKTRRCDYVRMLALLTEYKKKGSEVTIAKGCRSQDRFELYYEKYINAVVLDLDSEQFGKFSTMIGLGNVQSRIEKLKDYIDKLTFNKAFSSIIDADISLFGLTYQVLFCNKNLDVHRFDELKDLLENKARAFRSDANHRNAPNGLIYLRKRIKQSIDIYSRLVI